MGDFRGSFSGYERDVFFLSPGAGQPFIEVGHGLGVDHADDGRAVAPLDMDGDGDLDLAVLSLQGFRLYQNQSPPQGFVRVRLEGPPGNPNALGAVVQVETARHTQVALVTLTAGFHTQISPELHFGLGAAERVEGVEVRWPDGRVERFGPQPRNRVLVIGEGKNTIQVKEIPRWPAQMAPRAQGRTLDVVAQTLEGQPTRLAARGRPVVVNFWAPWCKACETELPALGTLAQALEGQVSFVGVSLEVKDVPSVQAFAKRHGIAYPQRLATDAVIEAFFGKEAEITLPATFVFGPQGELRRAFHREITAEDLRAVLGTLRTGPAPEDRIELADLAHTEGRLADERALLEQALEAAPDDPVTVNDVALRLMRMRQAGIARAVLEDAARRMPEVPEIWANLASVLGAEGQLDAAERAIKKALALAPKNPVALNGEGMLLLSRGQVGEAAARFRAALEADPLFEIARINLEQVEARLPP